MFDEDSNATNKPLGAQDTEDLLEALQAYDVHPNLQGDATDLATQGYLPALYKSWLSVLGAVRQHSKAQYVFH